MNILHNLQNGNATDKQMVSSLEKMDFYRLQTGYKIQTRLEMQSENGICFVHFVHQIQTTSCLHGLNIEVLSQIVLVISNWKNFSVWVLSYGLKGNMNQTSTIDFDVHGADIFTTAL